MPCSMKHWGVFRDTLYVCSKFIMETFSGLEATGNVAKAPAKFTVETFGAGDGDLAITVKGPDGTDYKVDKTFNNDRKKSYSCSYYPDKEGDFTVPILWGALTTSTGSGMAYADWPFSDGELMPESSYTQLPHFLEHFHRVFASGTGLVALALWIWLAVSGRADRRATWTACLRRST